jgi:hypothetical protein
MESKSTGYDGCIWGFVPPENKIERAQAMLEHWQDSLARDLEIKERIDPRIEEARQRIPEVERDLIAASFSPNKP